jgi:Ca-activated chloride channel family protein
MMQKYIDWKNIEFAYPWVLWLLCLIPFLIIIFTITKYNKYSTFKVSKYNFKHIHTTLKLRLFPLMSILRYTALAFIIIALARPQNTQVNEIINSEGYDIVLSMDISGSMLAQDFKPNRIEAAKKVALDFVLFRPGDRIGLVIFSGESFSQCPLTTDKNILTEQIHQIRSGLLEDGTAIGMGLATAVDRLRDSKSKSKIIILMTDGVNNIGLIDPITALEIAKAYKIRVYTIGVGSMGTAPYPVQDPLGNTQMQNMPVQIDEELMRKISKETGGKYYRATDNNVLKNVFGEIDKLEKSKIEIDSYKKHMDLFPFYLFIALTLLIVEFLLRFLYFKNLHE